MSKRKLIQTAAIASLAAGMSFLASTVNAAVVAAVDVNAGADGTTYDGTFTSPVDGSTASFVGNYFPAVPDGSPTSFTTSGDSNYSTGSLTFAISRFNSNSDRGDEATDAGTYQDLYRDLVIAENGTLTISGLNPSTLYGITIQSYEPAYPYINSTFTPATNGTNPPGQTTNNDGNADGSSGNNTPPATLFDPNGSVTFDGTNSLLSNASGEIIFNLTGGSSVDPSEVRINGIEIYTATPEPAMLSLLGLGALGLLARRRRPA